MTLTATEIFVFGSNLAGRHGAGSALEARKNWGAVYGQGIGRTGNSYAIPTKDRNLKTLPLSTIHKYVRYFIEYATKYSDITFKVVDIGCGLAGYGPNQIAPMFVDAPDNVHFLGKLGYFVTKERLKDNPCKL